MKSTTYSPDAQTPTALHDNSHRRDTLQRQTAAVFHWQLKSLRTLFWLFLAVSVIGTVVVVVSICLPTLDRVYYSDLSAQALQEMQLGAGRQAYVTCIGLFGMGGAALFSLLYGITQFSYLYNREQTDLHHSLPAARSAQFWGRYLAGIASLLPPVVAGLLCNALTLFSIGCITPERLLLYFRYLAVLVLLSIAAYSFVVLVLVCTSSTFEALLSMVVLVLSVPAVYLLGAEVITLTIPSTNKVLITATDGIYGLVLYLFRDEFSLLLPVVFWLLFIGGCTALGAFFYRRRKSEITASSSRVLKLLCAVLGSAAAGLFAARTVYHSQRYNTAFTYLLLVMAVSALVYYVLQALYFRSPRPRTRRLLPYLAFPALFAIFLLTISFGLGLDRPRTPTDLILNAQLLGTNLMTEDSVVLPEGGQVRDYESTPLPYLQPDLHSPEILQELETLQELLFRYERAKQFPYLIARDSSPEGFPSKEVTLAYITHLTDNSTYRQYLSFTINHKPDNTEAEALAQQIQDQIKRLIQNPDFIAGVFPVCGIDAVGGISVFDTERESGYQVPVLTLSDLPDEADFRKKLEAALRSDFENGRYRNRTEKDSTNVFYNLEYQPYEEFTARGGLLVEEDAGKSENAAGKVLRLGYESSFTVDSHMTETYALLQSVCTPEMLKQG